MPKRLALPTADPHLTFTAAAARLGVSRHSVFKLVALDELRLAHSAGKPVITRASLEAYERRQAGATVASLLPPAA